MVGKERQEPGRLSHLLLIAAELGDRFASLAVLNTYYRPKLKIAARRRALRGGDESLDRLLRNRLVAVLADRSVVRNRSMPATSKSGAAP